MYQQYRHKVEDQNYEQAWKKLSFTINTIEDK